MKTEKKLLLMTSLGFIVALLLLAGGFYYLKFMMVADIQAKTDAVQKSINDEDTKKKALMATADDNDQLRKIANTLEKKLPPATPDAYDRLITQIEGFCQQAKVRYGSISPVTNTTPPGAGAKKDKLYNTITVKFEISGKFYDLVNFMYLIESETRLMKIDEFGFTVSSASKDEAAGTGDTTLSLLMKVTAFIGLPKEAKK